MKLLAAADDNGSLKELVCVRGTDTSVQSAPQPDKIEIFHPQGIRKRILKFISVELNKEKYLIALRLNGDISIYKANESYDLINTLTDNLMDEDDKFVSIIEKFNIIIAITEKGKLTLIDLDSILSEKVITTTTTIKGPITAFIPHPEQKGIYAYGGKENEIKIIKLFDSEVFNTELKYEILFQAKNVKHDKLQLRVPVWISNILFIELSKHTEKSWLFITTTRYGQVRKYDTSHGKRPIYDKKLSDKPLLCMTSTSIENEIICSDNHSTTALFNINKGILVAKFKGSVGAIQDLSSYLTTNENLLITGGLDRYIRVFDINTRKQVIKVFMGSQISKVYLLDPVDVEKEQETTETKKKVKKSKITDEEEDEFWETLKSNKKRKV